MFLRATLKLYLTAWLFFTAPTAAYAEPIDPDRPYEPAEVLEISKSAPVLYFGDNISDNKPNATDLGQRAGLYVLKLRGNPNPDDVSFYMDGEFIEFKHNGVVVKRKDVEGRIQRYITVVRELKEGKAIARTTIDPQTSKMVTNYGIYELPTYSSKDAKARSENAIVLLEGRQKQEVEDDVERPIYTAAGRITKEHQVPVYTFLSKKKGKGLQVYAFGEEILKYKNGADAIAGGTVVQEVGDYLRQR